jgi:hypothetical protein
LSCLNNLRSVRKSYNLDFLTKIYLILCFFFALAVTSDAQVTVSANLTDGTGATFRTAYLHFQLLNCGDNFPAVPSSPSLIVQIHLLDADCGDTFLCFTSTGVQSMRCLRLTLPGHRELEPFGPPGQKRERDGLCTILSITVTAKGR